MTDIDEYGRRKPPLEGGAWDWHSAAEDSPEQLLPLWHDAVDRPHQFRGWPVYATAAR